MNQPNANVIMIVTVVGLVVVILLIRFLARLGANKAEDAIRNAKAKSDMKKNPPQQENLSDRYK